MVKTEALVIGAVAILGGAYLMGRFKQGNIDEGAQGGVASPNAMLGFTSTGNVGVDKSMLRTDRVIERNYYNYQEKVAKEEGKTERNADDEATKQNRSDNVTSIFSNLINQKGDARINRQNILGNLANNIVDEVGETRRLKKENKTPLLTPQQKVQVATKSVQLAGSFIRKPTQTIRNVFSKVKSALA